jgi:TRAP-type uncharacterized transport system fused permease subunit
MNASSKKPAASSRETDLPPEAESVAQGVDDEVVEANRRLYGGWRWWLFATLAVLYSSFHLISLNLYPLETWSYRIIHICGALILGYGLYASTRTDDDSGADPPWARYLSLALAVPALYALSLPSRPGTSAIRCCSPLPAPSHFPGCKVVRDSV